MRRLRSILILFLFFVNVATGQIISPQTPLRYSDTARRKEILKWSRNLVIPNKLHSADPSSVNFPGSVKAGYKAESAIFHLTHRQADAGQSKVFKKFVFSNPGSRTLYSTGLYAIAGQPIRVARPPSASTAKIYLVIGTHSDYLGTNDAKNEDWRRMPTISIPFELDSTFEFASSPFGGLIYLAIPPDEPSLDAEFTFENVVSAPYFKAGITPLADWKEQLKINKAPWGELASDKIILTLPDSTLQKIDDPEELLRVWDKILATEFELAQVPCPFIRPMRMVLDEQISVGAMHAGYPIMVMHSPSSGQFAEDIMINLNKLLIPSEGGANWGFFHEIGHNLQNWEWVFDGTTEVGCNFYSLYVFDQLLRSREGAHVSIKKSNQQNLITNFLAQGATYKAYKQDPFLGLIPFMQLQKEFGWEPFKKVFRWYLDSRSYDYDMAYIEDKEKANAFKIDRFVERFSVITNRNLVPFFRMWGIPVDKSVEERLVSLKTWVPKEAKKYVKL